MGTSPRGLSSFPSPKGITDMKKRVMNLVNFVRGCEPRQPWQDLYTPIKEEIAINKSYGFDHTVLMQYDAIIRPDMVEQIGRAHV